eukprot:jgi/Mesvir1/12333/Mv00520-RA.1
MFRLSVRIFEGRNFPVSDVLNEAEETSYFCKAVIGKRAGQTDDVPRVKRHQASWGGQELYWEVSPSELRDLQSTHGHFKVTCFQRRGLGSPLALGWVVLELRDAKLNAATDAAPQWMPLMGSGKPGSSPAEIRLSYFLRENGHRGAMPAEGGDAVNSRQEEETVRAPSPTEPAERGLEAVTAPRDDGPFMRFKLHVDVRSFHAGGHMPVQVASVAVTVRLPPELAEATPNGGSAVTAPIRSHPPIQVQRNSEEAILNGYACLELPMSERSMEALLSKNPRILAEISSVEKFSKDQIMGLASIPMAPLLREPAIDGYAPVLASGPGGKKVEVGGLRLFLALENLGPLAPAPGGAPPDTSLLDLAHAARQHEEAVRRLVASTKDGADPASADVNSSTDGAVAQSEASQGQRGGGAAALEGHDSMNAVTDASTSGGFGGGVLGNDPEANDIQPSFNGWAAEAGLGASGLVADDGMQGVMAVPSAKRGPLLHGTPEYEAAYEIELWKRAEKARWLSELKAKEEARVRILENEWRKQEHKRKAALMEVQEEAAGQREKVKLLLAVVEEREKKVIAAEEAVLLKRQQLEREYAQATQEAQSVMRRMQEDCEHLVEIERNRYADMERHCALLEKRLRAANARVEDLENKFHQYKQEHGSTSVAQLMLEVANLQKEKAEAVRRAESAHRSKQQLRAQAVKLARELASLKWQRDKEAALLMLVRGAKADGIQSLASLVRAHDKKETEFLGDVLNVKHELESLKLQRRKEEEAAATATVQQASYSGRLPYGSGAPQQAYGAEGNKTMATGSYTRAPSYSLAPRGVNLETSKGSGGMAPLRPRSQPGGDDALEFARNVPSQPVHAWGPTDGQSRVAAPLATSHGRETYVTSNAWSPAIKRVQAMPPGDALWGAAASTVPDASSVPLAAAARNRSSQLPTAWMSKENLSHLVKGLDMEPPQSGAGGVADDPNHPDATAGDAEIWPGQKTGEGKPRAERQLSAEGEVARLHRERAALLRTGAYKPGDALVAELDRRIASISGGT